MKIAIVCAGGKQGRCLTDEAVRRGHEVTGFVRSAFEGNPSAKYVVKDLFALTREDLADFDAVIDAFGAWTPETLPQHATSLMHLADIVKGTGIRLLVVGGAGGLYADESKTVRVMDTAGFPDAFKPLASAMAAAYDRLKSREDVDWTYLAPSADFDANGARTGKYTSGGEVLLADKNGVSRISYADYAIAMIDEAEADSRRRERFTVCRAD